MRLLGSILRGVALAGLLASPPAAAAGQADGQLAAVPRLKADRLVILKSERRLVLMRGDEVVRVYRVALGRYPKGRKVREGDAKTPEGSYTIDHKLTRSNFYKAIQISYPNLRDVARANALGYRPGGKIMIHGLPNRMSAARVGHPVIDWTQGCIAVTNREMDEIWRMVDAGTPIEIHP
ncbi:MAG: L,D-transpeptidase family protein [Alphaproteobacteria bacterium]